MKVWKVEDKANIRDYTLLNTYLLSPMLLRNYLLLDIEKDTKSKNKNNAIIQKFVEDIVKIDIKNEWEIEKFLVENDNYLNMFITIGLSSYELLGRLNLYLSKKYENGKVNEGKLKEYIEKYYSKNNKLPDKSSELKKALKRSDYKELVSLIVTKAFSGVLSDFLRESLINGDIFDSILKSIKKEYEKPFEGLKEIINIAKDNNAATNEAIKSNIINLLNFMYTYSSKGQSKAEEGYKYEDILIEYLTKNGINAKKINKKVLGRKWDVAIYDNKENLKILVEVMYMLTTSSGQTNKRKTIIRCAEDLNKTQGYEIAVLMDGAGWLSRTSDAQELLSKVIVFTFHKESLEKFVKYIKTRC
ncbi:hypothetical protein THYS13_13310 [Thermoanaerobacter sp. YS13]|uniref:hypothetical protein n=1 Tax=Thermoanaerobacter sp. YS13 TaxID=1511746 RepID=UPI0005745181|nr:hypothetical protein [Thermoanaerobacter sp. YS13]KHO63210.1 hypothetical protein THYS13_13310 [Thermoanaerobacter sp. YS13]